MHQSGFTVLSGVTFLMGRLKQVSRRNTKLSPTRLPSSSSLAQPVFVSTSLLYPLGPTGRPQTSQRPYYSSTCLYGLEDHGFIVISRNMSSVNVSHPDKLSISYCFIITLLICRFSVPHPLHRTLVRCFWIQAAALKLSEEPVFSGGGWPSAPLQRPVLWVRGCGSGGTEGLWTSALNPGRGALGNGGVLLLFQSSDRTSSSQAYTELVRGGPFRLEQDPNGCRVSTVLERDFQEHRSGFVLSLAWGVEGERMGNG